MNINPNMMNMIQMIMKGGNPQDMVLSMIEQRSANNPFMQNLLSLAKNGQINDIETIARNMVKESGKDFDTEFNSFKRNLGFK